MSAIVFAATAQFAALDAWHHPLPIASLVLGTFIINSRHLFMGLSIEKPFRQSSVLMKVILPFFMIDESWALSLSEHDRSQLTPVFLITSGSVMYVAWVLSTIAGASIERLIAARVHPASLALDAVLPCVLAILLGPRWKSARESLPVWMAAGLASGVSAKFIHSSGSIVLGCLGGITASLIERRR
jgi:branched chain amino acid efflux pump